MFFQSILFVCEGNICRSPMAEGYFRHKLAEHQATTLVGSAGLGAMVGYSADDKALNLMQQRGIDISQHRARQLDDKLIKQFDLILVMTNQQCHSLERRFPVAKGKVFLLGQWQRFEVGDPYGATELAFEKVYQQIEQAWQDWKQRIIPCSTTV